MARKGKSKNVSGTAGATRRSATRTSSASRPSSKPRRSQRQQQTDTSIAIKQPGRSRK